MSLLTPEMHTPARSENAQVVLELTVNNHPGVMSHICGLFARRSFNLDGIVCLPVGDRTCSAILLAVNEDERLDQLIRQLRKLEDVIDVTHAQDAVAAFEAARPWLR